MAVAQTLKEIALEKAKKRPELVDYLTEEAPILTLLKWIPATHGLWNVEEVLDEITGASFTDLGAPLPTMQAETQLRQTYVSLMGGEIEVSKDKAAQFGGAKQYFARRENAFYRQAGMDTELAIWRDYWRKAALKDRLFTSCGGRAARFPPSSWCVSTRRSMWASMTPRSSTPAVCSIPRPSTAAICTTCAPSPV